MLWNALVFNGQLCRWRPFLSTCKMPLTTCYLG